MLFRSIGHSERRAYHEETDALVNAKARAALGAASSMITGDEPPATMAESPGSAPTDPRLEVFRDFVNSLDPDLGGSRGGPAAD